MRGNGICNRGNGSNGRWGGHIGQQVTEVTGVTGNQPIDIQPLSHVCVRAHVCMCTYVRALTHGLLACGRYIKKKGRAGAVTYLGVIMGLPPLPRLRSGFGSYGINTKAVGVFTLAQKLFPVGDGRKEE